MYLNDDTMSWLADALVELKGLRGWAWEGRDFDAFREVLGECGENADNF